MELGAHKSISNSVVKNNSSNFEKNSEFVMDWEDRLNDQLKNSSKRIALLSQKVNNTSAVRLGILSQGGLNVLDFDKKRENPPDVILCKDYLEGMESGVGFVKKYTDFKVSKGKLQLPTPLKGSSLDVYNRMKLDISRSMDTNKNKTLYLTLVDPSDVPIIEPATVGWVADRIVSTSKIDWVERGVDMTKIIVPSQNGTFIAPPKPKGTEPLNDLRFSELKHNDVGVLKKTAGTPVSKVKIDDFLGGKKDSELRIKGSEQRAIKGESDELMTDFMMKFT